MSDGSKKAPHLRGAGPLRCAMFALRRRATPYVAAAKNELHYLQLGLIVEQCARSANVAVIESNCCHESKLAGTGLSVKYSLAVGTAGNRGQVDGLVTIFTNVGVAI